MNNLRKLYYYFGRDEKFNYIATPMQSALIAGRCGSGKSTLLNSLLIRLIQECNPNTLDIRIHGFKGMETSAWSDLIPDGRKLPHVSRIVSYSIGQHFDDLEKDKKYRHDFTDFVKDLDNLADTVEERVQLCMSRNLRDYSDYINSADSQDKAILFIVDEFQMITEDEELSHWFNDIVSYIASVSHISCVYIMLLSQSFRGLSWGTIDSFKIRAALPMDDETSNVLIGNNCAAMESEPNGIVWVKDGNSYPIRLYVPFYPDTWLRKFIGYSSVRE